MVQVCRSLSYSDVWLTPLLGIGFFYQNFGALGTWAAKRNTSVYALDWLGMGRSARVPFKVHAKRDDIKGRVEESESFFLDALEEWREKMGIEKMCKLLSLHPHWGVFEPFISSACWSQPRSLSIDGIRPPSPHPRKPDYPALSRRRPSRPKQHGRAFP
jgi:hypothetical protein